MRQVVSSPIGSILRWAKAGKGRLQQVQLGARSKGGPLAWRANGELGGVARGMAERGLSLPPIGTPVSSCCQALLAFMNLPTPAKLCIGLGLIALALVVANQGLAPDITPPLERAAVLASLLAVVLMLVGVLWTRALPEASIRAELSGDQGFVLIPDLPEALADELAWGSHMLLTASPAAVVLILWRGSLFVRRGLLSPSVFTPGAICHRALERQSAISLVDLKLYPGRQEFDALLPGLPSVLVQPLGQDGLIVLGGWSARCFSRSDLAWVEGWAAKIRVGLEMLPNRSEGPSMSP